MTAACQTPQAPARGPQPAAALDCTFTSASWRHTACLGSEGAVGPPATSESTDHRRVPFLAPTGCLQPPCWLAHEERRLELRSSPTVVAAAPEAGRAEFGSGSRRAGTALRRRVCGLASVPRVSVRARSGLLLPAPLRRPQLYRPVAGVRRGPPDAASRRAHLPGPPLGRAPPAQAGGKGPWSGGRARAPQDGPGLLPRQPPPPGARGGRAGRRQGLLS